MINPFLIGPHVYLRPLEVSDAATLLPWVNDAEILHWLRMYRPMGLTAEEKFIEKMSEDTASVVFFIARKEDDAPLGMCGLHGIDPKNRHAEFGILIGDKSTWGRGHGTGAARLLMDYAFETLNLNRVQLHVHADNERAIRSYVRLGFQREGVMRELYFRKGRYADSVLMSLLRSDWDRTRS